MTLLTILGILLAVAGLYTVVLPHIACATWRCAYRHSATDTTFETDLFAHPWIVRGVAFCWLVSGGMLLLVLHGKTCFADLPFCPFFG